MKDEDLGGLGERNEGFAKMMYLGVGNWDDK